MTEQILMLAGSLTAVATATGVLLREIRATCRELRALTEGGIPVRIVNEPGETDPAKNNGVRF